MGKMGLLGIPLDRVYLINPGQSLDVGDRKLIATSPPTYDAPETCGLFDTKHNTLISADSFGAIMQETADAAEAINPDALREGCISWATIDAPWLNKIDQAKFNDSLSDISKLNATTILSSHLPPARGINNELLSYLKDATQVPRFVGPDQAALEKMMAA
jgi:flavorubredoxin